MQLLDTTATIDTPERVCFRHRLAGPGQRCAAWGIDVGVQILLILFLIALLIPFGAVPGLDGVGQGLMMFALFVIQWFYGAVFETLLSGRTPGKLLLDLRVVRVDGSPGQLPDYLLRNLLRSVDFLPSGFGLGVLSMTIDPKLRRLGDLVAGTVVVAEDKAHMLGGVTLDPPVSEAERQALPPRVDLSRSEVAVIEDLLRRRARLSDDRAEELARLLGPSLSERTGVEADSWERVLTLAYARATGRDRPPAQLSDRAASDLAVDEIPGSGATGSEGAA